MTDIRDALADLCTAYHCFKSTGAGAPQHPNTQESRCKATWKRELKLRWRETGPRIHLDGEVDSDQQVVKELSLFKHSIHVGSLIE